jgi:hypothetical protein
LVRSWGCNPPAPRRQVPPFSCWGAANRFPRSRAPESAQLARGRTARRRHRAGRLRRVGEFRFRPEHMAVRVHAPRGRPVFRFGGVGVKWNVLRTHRHDPCSLGLLAHTVAQPPYGSAADGLQYRPLEGPRRRYTPCPQLAHTSHWLA